METHVICSEPSYTAYVAQLRKLYEDKRFLTCPPPRIGQDRSIDQNSLLHVWLTEYAAHLLNKAKNQVTAGELEGMKRQAKGAYYRETHERFMVHKVINPKTGECKTDYTSSADWKVGELYHFLNWLQMVAAGDGLVLKSKGQHARLTREAKQ